MIFNKETEAEEREDDPYKFGIPRLRRNLNKRNNPSDRQRKRISLALVKNVNGILVPEWAQSFLGVDAVARFYIGCFPWQTKPGTKAETKFFTMLAEIKVKWYSTDLLAHAKGFSCTARCLPVNTCRSWWT